MKNIDFNKDIDLSEIITVLFKNKWKIILIPFLITILSILYFNFDHEEEYRIVTKIYPINSKDEENYNTYNFLTPILLKQKKKELENFVLVQNDVLNKQEKNLINLGLSSDNLPNIRTTLEFDYKFLTIDNSLLLDLFIEEIKKKEILKEEIKKSKLVDQKIYKDNLSLEIILNRLVSQISIDEKKNTDNQEAPGYWEIEFITSDKNSWERVLASIEKPLNEKVRLYLEEVMKNKIENFEKVNLFVIQDLDNKILNTIELNKQKNKLRLIYLDEQAKLARKMNLQKNSNLESIQTFISDQAGTISNFRTESPYYMRGYEIIEKEIELIKGKNENILTEELLLLQNYKKTLIENKNIDRLNESINQTPIINSEKFKAAKIDLTSTTFTKIESRRSKIIMIGLISLILTIMSVLIKNSYINNKINI